MSKFTRRVGGALAALALIGASFANAAPASAAPAKVALHDLILQNVGTKPIIVCNHWGYPPQRHEGPSCSINGSYTEYFTLGHNQWSDRRPISQTDIDGYFVPKNCKMKEKALGYWGTSRNLTGYHTKPRYHKLSPDVTTIGIKHHRKIFLVCR